MFAICEKGVIGPTLFLILSYIDLVLFARFFGILDLVDFMIFSYISSWNLTYFFCPIPNLFQNIYDYKFQVMISEYTNRN